jgi:hypothetical protein
MESLKRELEMWKREAEAWKREANIVQTQFDIANYTNAQLRREIAELKVEKKVSVKEQNASSSSLGNNSMGISSYHYNH